MGNNYVYIVGSAKFRFRNETALSLLIHSVHDIIIFFTYVYSCDANIPSPSP